MRKRQILKKITAISCVVLVLLSLLAVSASALYITPIEGYSNVDLFVNAVNLPSLTAPSDPIVIATYSNPVLKVAYNDNTIYNTGGELTLRAYNNYNRYALELVDSNGTQYARMNSNSVAYRTASGTFATVSSVLIYYNDVSVINDELYNYFIVNPTGGNVDEAYNEGYQAGFEAGASGSYMDGYEDALASINGLGRDYIWAGSTLHAYWDVNGTIYDVPVNFTVNGDTATFANTASEIRTYCSSRGIALPSYIDLHFFFTEDYLAFNFNDTSVFIGSGVSYIFDIDMAVSSEADFTDMQSFHYFGAVNEGGKAVFKPSEGTSFPTRVFSFESMQSVDDLERLTLVTNIGFDNFSYRNGYVAGLNDGLAGGGATAVEDAWNKGYTTGRDEGFITGKQEGLALAEQGDFRELMLSVVDAPVSVFRNMLNFEILGFNVLSFVTAILSTCLLVIIIKRFL